MSEKNEVTEVIKLAYRIDLFNDVGGYVDYVGSSWIEAFKPGTIFPPTVSYQGECYELAKEEPKEADVSRYTRIKGEPKEDSYMNLGFVLRLRHPSAFPPILELLDRAK